MKEQAVTFTKLSCVALLAVLVFITPARADKAVLVLDASGSMNAKIDGRPKIEIARNVIRDLMKDWPAKISLGLMAYGHREKDNCKDIQTLVQVGPVQPVAILAALDDVTPKGKTPLTDAVRLAANEMQSEEGKATVILVSDGLETCDADPCAAAAELKKADIDFTVHVVGFGTTEEENKKLKCIADNTGGQLLAANNLPELKTAMLMTAELVRKPTDTVKPVAFKPSTVFSDSFDGTELSKDWSVKNENRDSYLVENGSILMFAQKKSGIAEGSADNIIELNNIKLEGDWDISLDVRPDFPNGRDRVELAVMSNGKAAIRAILARDGNATNAQAVKVLIASSGATDEQLIAVNSWSNSTHDVNGFVKFLYDLKEQGGTLALSKRGRKYYASFNSPLLKRKVYTAEITVLRADGQPAFTVSQWEQVPNQVSAYVDAFRIDQAK